MARRQGYHRQKRKTNLIMSIPDIISKIKRYLKKEDRKDVEFRALIALTELGDIVKYITHDPKLNPDARPYGAENDEKLAYGQALIQTIATMVLRGINVEEAIEMGLRNWEEADWRNKDKKRKKRKLKKISGILAFSGNVKGKAYVLSRKHPIEKMPYGSILVARMVNPGMITYLIKASGIITDQGAMNSHAAIISKEQRIPCLVGTGNASTKIRHGGNIKIIVRKKKGLVELE